MWILQEYRYVLILSALFLWGLVALMFSILEGQNLAQYETNFIVKYEQIKDVQGKTLKDVVLNPDGSINGLENSTLFWNLVQADQMFLLDDYNSSNIEDLVVDVPDPGTQGVYYFTTSSFSDGTSNNIDVKDILTLPSDSNFIDGGLDVPQKGWVLYIFEDEETALEMLEEYFPTGNIVTVDTLGGPRAIGVQTVFQENTAARASSTVDTEAPVITLIGSGTIDLQVNTTYLDPGVNANDNNDSSSNLIIDIDDSAVDISTVGTYPVIITVTDSQNNSSTITRQVNVIPTPNAVPPVITLVWGNISLEAGSAYSEPGYSASDDVDGDITSNVTITGSVDENTLGTYTLTYDVIDSSNNSATTLTRIVTVEDTTAPLLSLNGLSTINLVIGDSYIEQWATSIDAYEGDLTPSIINGWATVNTASPWTYILTYTSSDSSSNSASLTRYVIVADNVNPVITLVWGTIIVEAGSSYSEPGYSASDNVSGDLTASVNVSGSVNTSTPGIYTLTYTVSDSSSNSDSKTRTVMVQDTSNPTLTLVWGNVSIEAGSSYSEPGYSASDSTDGDLTSSVSISGSVNANVPGTYTLTYTVSDSSSNSDSKTRTITVSDNTIPVITLVWGNSTIEAGSSYSELWYSASDNLDGNLTSSVNVSGSVNANIPGTYTISYNVTDNAGNSATQKQRVITVQDTVVPIINLTGWNLTLNVGDTFIEPGYSASDNINGNITSTVNITWSVNTSIAGTYTLNYNVDDNSGNSATQKQRTVTVVDPYTQVHNNTSNISSDYESVQITIPSAADELVIDLDATTPGDSSVEFRLATVDTLTPLAINGQVSNTASNTTNYSHCGMQGSVFYTRKRNSSGNLNFDCRNTNLNGGYTGQDIFNLPVGSIIKFYNPAATESWTNEIIYGTIASKLSDSGAANASEYLYFATKTGDYERPGVWNCSGTCVPGFKSPSATQSYTAELVNNNYTLIGNSNLDGSTAIDISGMTNSSYVKYRLWLTPDSTTGAMPTVNGITIKHN